MSVPGTPKMMCLPELTSLSRSTSASVTLVSLSLTPVSSLDPTANRCFRHVSGYRRLTVAPYRTA